MGWLWVLSLPHGFSCRVSVCSQLQVPWLLRQLQPFGVWMPPLPLVIQNTGTSVIYHQIHESRLSFKGNQEIVCTQCLSTCPVGSCLWCAPGHSWLKALHKIKWKMYGKGGNWGRNPKSGQKSWPLDLFFGFHHQSSVDLQPGRNGCP